MRRHSPVYEVKQCRIKICCYSGGGEFLSDPCPDQPESSGLTNNSSFIPCNLFTLSLEVLTATMPTISTPTHYQLFSPAHFDLLLLLLSSYLLLFVRAWRGSCKWSQNAIAKCSLPPDLHHGKGFRCPDSTHIPSEPCADGYFYPISRSTSRTCSDRAQGAKFVHRPCKLAPFLAEPPSDPRRNRGRRYHKPCQMCDRENSFGSRPFSRKAHRPGD